jgi:hypothetical protein
MLKSSGQVGLSPLHMKMHVPYNQRYTDEVNGNVDFVTMIRTIECQLYWMTGDVRDIRMWVDVVAGTYVIVRRIRSGSRADLPGF